MTVGVGKHNGGMSTGAVDDGGSAAALNRFDPLVRDWFTAAFAEPTTAQAGAWDAIGKGDHTLVVAPTGSGKTLAAFLSAIDDLVSRAADADAAPTNAQRCTVLYLSPLKALAVDVERNLRSPLNGIGAVAARAGVSAPQISVAVRSGDTPSGDRRAFARDGADILITTPESLFLLLTSRAREMLTGVRTVIIDEVHAVAGTKRGAHLAVSLDRLDALLDRPAQRIGLSATVRPVEEVARFLTGGRPVTVVQPPSTKQIDVDVVVPVPDMSALGTTTGDLTGKAAGEVARTSIWPHVEERVVDLIESHRSTIVFANSRRLAERLTARLNEIHGERLEARQLRAEAERSGPAAQVMAQSGTAVGAPAVLAKAHHGSVSREQRSLIEDELKTGLLPAVVATSSLELGIDMGAVDLVIQVESPPSVASGLQRIGRAGHQVGAPSHGVMFPKFRGDLISAAVVAGRMQIGAIESLAVIANPLDIAAQQIVAICAMDPITVDDLLELLRRSAPFAALGRGALETVLDMLSGRYPSEQFAELRPRLTWDRTTGLLTGRPGAQRLAVTSGGTIPDRGLYGVFLAGGEGPGRRVGELDEEMVYESRVGDVFALGSSSWRIVDITRDQVLVLPAPGLPGRLPFWKGDTLGRPAELGRAHGEFVREISGAAAAVAQERLDGGRAGRVRAAQPGRLPGRTEKRHRGGSRREDPGHRTVPRRAGRLADRAAFAVRGGRARTVGVGDLRPDARAVRRRRRRDARRRRHRAAAAGRRIRERSTGFRRLRGAGPADARGRGDRGDRRRGDLRGPLPGVRGPGIAVAAQADRQASAALAAAPAGDPAARGGLGLSVVPDRGRGGPRVPVRCVRRAGPGRPDARAGGQDRADRRGHHAVAVAVRLLAAVRLCRAVPVRGRLAAGGTARGGPHRRPDAAGRTARARRRAVPAGPVGSELAGRHRIRAAAGRGEPARPQPRRDRRPAADSRSADDHRGRPAELGGRRRRRADGARVGAPGDRGPDRR